MKPDKKPESRLTVIFILAIILSGSGLAYFSINNISNLKELTEKKILEEQSKLAGRFSAANTEFLEKVTSDLSREIIPPYRLKDSMLKMTADFNFISQPFILNQNDQYVYPNFIGIQETQPYVKLSDNFLSAFSEGERAEFSEKNLQKARGNYISCLGYSSGRSDSAKALNSLGRIAVKMNNSDAATGYYSRIIMDYSTVTDADRFPYVYYALPQLLKIAIKDNSEIILPLIQDCLEKMEAGSVPLNYYTEDLVTLVMDKLKELNSDNTVDITIIRKLATGIKQQIQFISIYGNEISELVKKGNWDNYQSIGDDFILADPVSGSPGQYLLIKSDPEYNVGFIIDSKKLFDTVVSSDLQNGIEFDYRIDFPDNFNSETTRNNLVYTSQLRPWFPDQQIEISLVDENLIRDIVSRRSWIYGLASVMLLVAMCLGVVLILRDIARERNLSRLRSDFISNVTHELKTPLTSIRMYAESLIMGRVNSEEKRNEYLEVVVHESDRLKGMINNILEFSKMEKGTPEYHFSNTDLALIIKEATAEMSHWFSQEGFEISTELEENISADVDPEKIKQALINLFSNAIKYSPDTKKIFIRLFRNTDNACIEVEDRGIGIPEDKLSRIFEPFYRIGQEEGASGTGLGLTVVKEIIEAHKGTISATSEIGKGSKFKILIPFVGK